MISRLSARDLGSPITLGCTADVGILAASGRLLLAVLGALGALTIHLVLRPAGRLIGRATQSDTDTVTTPSSA